MKSSIKRFVYSINNETFPKHFLFYKFMTSSDISAREHGSNKQVASKSCALSLVRQLYHLKVIEAYTGQLKKKEADKVGTFAFLPWWERDLSQIYR